MTTININNVPLGYTEAGKGNERTIVFAPPLLWGAEMFDGMLAELAKDFHVIAIDIHGHGQSGFRAPLTIDGMTDDFNILLEKLDLSKVIWVGISIGGMIGMRLALAHPEKLDALILMATNSHLDKPEIKKQTLHLWEMFRDGERESIVEPALPILFAKNTFETQPELIEHFRNELIGFKEVGGMFAAATAVFERDDLSDKIGAIETRTLIIAGDEDITATAQEAEFMASRIPNAELKIFEETNHLLAVEKPLEAAETIRAFLTKRISNMNDLTQKFVRNFFKHLAERNLKELTALFAERVDWYIPGDASKAPWLGIRNNRQEVSDFFELLWKNTEPVSAKIENIFTDEENAVITGEFSTKMLETGNVVDSLFCIQMHIQDNKIVRYRLLEDSFAVSKSLTK